MFSEIVDDDKVGCSSQKKFRNSLNQVSLIINNSNSEFSRLNFFFKEGGQNISIKNIRLIKFF